MWCGRAVSSDAAEGLPLRLPALLLLHSKPLINVGSVPEDTFEPSAAFLYSPASHDSCGPFSETACYLTVGILFADFAVFKEKAVLSHGPCTIRSLLLTQVFNYHGSDLHTSFLSEKESYTPVLPVGRRKPASQLWH